MTEKELQGSVYALAKAFGWTTYHTHDSRRSERGFPDLVLVHRKRGLMFRELKAENGRLSPYQKEWISVLTEAGQDIAVWNTADWHEGRILAELKGE